MQSAVIAAQRSEPEDKCLKLTGAYGHHTSSELDNSKQKHCFVLQEDDSSLKTAGSLHWLQHQTLVWRQLPGASLASMGTTQSLALAA